MTTWAVLATGPSLTQQVADTCRAAGLCIAAVSDAYKLAPRADLLVSTDPRWWKHHPEAVALDVPKFAASMHFNQVHGVEPCTDLGTHINSGLLACHLAVKHGATRLLLCGFDFRPGHFFGNHPAPLANTSPARYEAFQKQFAGWKPRGVTVVNCTPGSGLRAFPLVPLEEAIDVTVN